jgi:hypothetical protein
MSSEPLIRFRCAAIRRSGATEIRIIYATSVDAARDRLIAAGLEPATIEPAGPSLSDRLITRLRQRLLDVRYPAARAAVPNTDTPIPRARSVSKWVLTTLSLLATASATLMISSWTLLIFTRWQAEHVLQQNAAAIARYQDRMSDERIKMAARPAMTLPGPTEILGRLAAILPSDTGLAAATRDPQGVFRIELETSDPDQIRPIFASDPIFRSMKETGQKQTGEGTIHVTWTSALQ